MLSLTACLDLLLLHRYLGIRFASRMQLFNWHQFQNNIFFFFRYSELPGKPQPEDSWYTSDGEADPPDFPNKPVLLQFHLY